MPADGATHDPAAMLLADVLSLLTGDSRGAWIAVLRQYGGALPRDVRFHRDAIRWGRAAQAPGQVERDPRVFTRAWLTIPDARHSDGTVTPAHLITPAEALEAMSARGLWPWETGADGAPRWWCDGCEGSGLGAVDTSRGRRVYRCGECDSVGHTDAPHTLADLVAVASNPRLREAVTLAREVAGSEGAVVVLRVMGVRELREHHERIDREGTAGVRRRVFCSSLADVFEVHPMLDAWRADLWELIEACTALDWLLLTKRPEEIRRMVPPAWLTSWPSHVWVGCTVENQARADERVPHLLKIPARVRFLSCEPLLEAVNLEAAFCVTDRHGEPSDGRYNADGTPAISWVIVGGESGTDARPFDLAWARSIVRQCDEAGVPVFVKQLGARPVDSTRAAIHQPCIHLGKPAIRTTIHAADDPEVAQARIDERDERLRLARPQVQHPLYLREHFRLDDKAGANPVEWPADLRRQGFPR